MPAEDKNKDVEMTEDKNEKKEDEKKEEEVKEPNDKFYGKLILSIIHIVLCILELKKNLVLLEKASKDKDFKMAGTLTKNLKKLRKMFDLPDAVLALSFYLPDLFMRLMLPT